MKTNKMIDDTGKSQMEYYDSKDVLRIKGIN
jgi:hypothetical protein